jgi:2-polyprenyl-3-methyl-5-hydroxy-6-metoxy-1,4-benzoquinol methylase
LLHLAPQFSPRISKLALFFLDQKRPKEDKVAGGYFPMQLAILGPTCTVCGSARQRSTTPLKPQLCAVRVLFHAAECGDCGHWYLQDPPQSLSEYYGKSYPLHAPESWGAFRALVAKEKERETQKRCAIVRRYGRHFGSVLDVGCGALEFVRAISRVGDQVVGLDPEVTAPTDLPANAAFYAQDVLDYRHPEHSEGSRPNVQKFDIITLWHYLEHAASPRQTLQKIQALCHKETRVFIEVPRHDSWSQMQQGANWAGYHTPRHASMFTKASLSRLLQDQGFRIVHWQDGGTLHPVTFYWLGLMETLGGWRWPVTLRVAARIAAQVLALPGLLFRKDFGIQLVVVERN